MGVPGLWPVERACGADSETVCALCTFNAEAVGREGRVW